MPLRGSVLPEHPVFEKWHDHDGLTNATETACDFYRMTGQWADEITGVEPDPKLEDFYLLVSLKLGDPHRKDWLIENSMEFHAMLKKFKGIPPAPPNEKGAAVMIQYLLWYERDRPKD